MSQEEKKPDEVDGLSPAKEETLISTDTVSAKLEDEEIKAKESTLCEEKANEQTMDLKIVSVESRAEFNDDNEESNDSELVIDLDSNKRSEIKTPVNDEISPSSEGSENSKEVLSSENDQKIEDAGKSSDVEIVDDNREPDASCKDENAVVEKDKEIKTESTVETDETMASFEKLEKSLRDLQKSISMENEDVDKNIDSQDKDIAKPIISVSKQSDSEKSDENDKKQDDDKLLEEEMESLLNEFRESTKKNIMGTESKTNIELNQPSLVDNNKTNIELNQPSLVDNNKEKSENQSSDLQPKTSLCNPNSKSEEITRSDRSEKPVKFRRDPDSTHEKLKESSASKQLNQVNPDLEVIDSEKNLSKEESSGKSNQTQQKQKLYDSNELWSKMGMNRCVNCNFTTDNEALFQQHTCSKKSKKDICLSWKEEQYICESCSYLSSSKKKFEEHLAFHLLSHPFICLECKTTFETKSDIEIHVRSKHPQETVRCGLRASKKINDILDSLHRNGFYRFAGRILDGKSMNTMTKSKELTIETPPEVKGNNIDNSIRNKTGLSQTFNSESNINSDSSDSVVIYLSDSSTSVKNVVSQNKSLNVPSRLSAATNVVGSSSVAAANIIAAANIVASSSTAVTNAVASSSTVPGMVKVPISKSVKMQVYTSPTNAATSKVIPSYVTNNGPLLLIPVVQSNTAAGIPQSPTAVNIGTALGNIPSNIFATAAMQQGTTTHVPPKVTMPMNQQKIPVSPLVTTRVQGGQFFNLSQAIPQSPVPQTMIGNTQGTRLILVSDPPQNVQPVENQIYPANYGLPNIVSNVAMSQPVMPLVGQAVVSQNVSVTTSAPPPSYAETMKNKENKVSVTPNPNWTSILEKQNFSVQNNAQGIKTQQLSAVVNTNHPSSLQNSSSFVTSVPQPCTSTMAFSVASASSSVRAVPNAMTVNKVNVPIKPKPSPASSENSTGGVLATSMVMTGENKDGANKLFFRKSGAMYTCEYCQKDTISGEKFKEHIWKHFHEMQCICKNCSSKQYDASVKCSLVERVMNGLRCAAARQNSSSEIENKTVEPGISESVVVLSDDEEDKGSDVSTANTLGQNQPSKLPDEEVKKINSNISTTENDSSEKSKPIENESKEVNGTEKEMEQNGPELQLKITSIVSLHRYKNEDSPFEAGVDKESENLKESAKDNSKENMKDNENRPSGDSESSKNVDRKCQEKSTLESRNIFEKITSETGLQSENMEAASTGNNGKSQQNVVAQVQEINKTSSEDSVSVTVPNSGTKTGEATQKEDSKVDNVEVKHEYPTFNFGGSFYVCGFEGCSFKCMTSPEFRDHLSNYHSGASDFTCAHCGHKSYTEECYLRHMFVHSNAKSFVLFLCKSSGCKFGTNLMNVFKEHLNKTHQTDSFYKCSSCQESFPQIDDLVNHLQSNLLKFVQCPYCTVKDRNRKVILHHISQMHPGKAKQITVTSQLICQERESNAYVAPTPKNILSNQNVEHTLQSEIPESNMFHTSNISVKQEPVETLHETVSGIIDTEFRKVVPKKGASLVRNISEESDKSVFKSGNTLNSLIKCPHCSYVANGKGFLKKHLKAHDKGPSKQLPFICPYCPAESASQNKFTLHVGLHCGNQKPNGVFKIQVFYCSHCSFQSNLLGKVFTHGQKMHANFRKETDYTTSTLKIKSRSYICEPCMFYTREKEKYDNHLELHKNGDIPDLSRTSQNTSASSDQIQQASITTEHHLEGVPEGDIGIESRRFCCKDCGKTFKRLPHVKQHLSVHIKDEPYQLTYFRCSYCGFSSTSKLWISRHTEQKHPDKLIRIKRRVESVSSTKSEIEPAQITNSPRVSIDTLHCDCCAFSCSDKEDLIKHTKLHFVTSVDSKQVVNEIVEKPSKKPYDGPTEPFIIPAGNVYKQPVNCSKCSFSTKLRLELLRHVKMHPMLIPESEQSPRKEANPTDKATKLLVKTTFLKRRLSSSPEFKPRPKKKRVERLSYSEDEDEDEEMSADYDDESDNEIIPKKVRKDSNQPKKEESSKGSLYFLGGDLLHNKLKPCFSEEPDKTEYTCLYCGALHEEKYPLHRHLLQHMDVSFYKCAYCEFGALEVTPIMIHIQREHKKPIKHIQQDVKDVESKINKAIHEMKAEHYLGVDTNVATKPVIDNTDVKLEPVDDVSYETTEQSTFKFFKSSPSKSSSLKASPKLGTHVKKFGMLFKCRICGYTSSSKATVNRHGVVHTSFKRYACPYCIYRSHWKPDVLKHVGNVHAGEEVRAITDEAEDALTVSSPPEFAVRCNENLEGNADSEVGDSSRENELPILNQLKKEESPKKKVVGFNSSFKCNICKVMFKSKWAIHKHFRTTECGEISLYGCSLCRYKNTSQDEVLQHISSKHQFSSTAKVTTLGRSSKFRIHKVPVTKFESRDQENDGVKPKTESAVKPEGALVQIKIEKTRERSGLIKKVGNLYKCKVCSFRGQRSNVSRHLATHSQLIKHSCPFCNYKSNWKFNIKRHILKYHKEGNDQGLSEGTSSNIESTTVSEESQKDNKISDAINPPVQGPVKASKQLNENAVFQTKYKCLVCNSVTFSISGMYKHFKRGLCSSNQPMYGCSKCSFKNMSKEKVKIHISERHPNQNLSPTVLNILAKIKKVKTKVQINKSEEMTNKEETAVIARSRKHVEVKCPSCQYISPTRKLYQAHFDKTHKGMFLACTQCPYKTQLMVYLYKHSVTAHNTRDVQFEIHRKKMRNKDVRFQCPKCDHQAKKPNMRAHLYYHLDYRPIKCGHCNYKTRKQMIAKKHILSNHPGLPLKIIVKQEKQVEAEIDEMLSSMKVAESDLQQLNKSDAEMREQEKINCKFENCTFQCFRTKEMKLHVESVHIKIKDKSTEGETSDAKYEINKQLQKMSESNKKMKDEDFLFVDDPVFSPRKNYSTSYSTKLKQQVFKCIHCPYVSTVKKSMVSHYYHHVPRIFKCPHCDFRSYPKSRIVQHVTVNHAGKVIDIIDLRRTREITDPCLSVPQKISASQKKPHSGKAPTPPKKVKKEKKKFVSLGSYSDIFTSEGSSDENETDNVSVKTDSSYNRDPTKITYCCNFCSYKSSVFYHYRQHLATHGGFKWQTFGTVIESRLKCGMCSFLAINDEEFKSHMEKHLNTRPFICPYCDYSAFMTSSVKKHIVYRHPNKPVEAHKNIVSGDLVVTEGGPQKNIKLVEMEPKVKLVDIFSMESEEFEQLLTDAEVSVIDLQYIPDEKFDIVSKTLGFSSEDIMELEELASDDEQSDEDEDDDDETSYDQTNQDDANTEENDAEGTEMQDKETTFEDHSFVSTGSMEYETVDELSDSVTDEKKTLSLETKDASEQNETTESAYDNISDVEEDLQVNEVNEDKKSDEGDNKEVNVSVGEEDKNSVSKTESLTSANTEEDIVAIEPDKEKNVEETENLSEPQKVDETGTREDEKVEKIQSI